jgi:hypothetical protein
MIAALRCVCAVGCQAHQRLLCATRDPRGTVVVRTGAGSASADYDVSVLQQPPSVTSVTPPSWSTTNETLIVIVGVRCVRVNAAERFEFGVLGCAHEHGVLANGP